MHELKYCEDVKYDYRYRLIVDNDIKHQYRLRKDGKGEEIDISDEEYLTLNSIKDEEKFQHECEMFWNKHSTSRWMYQAKKTEQNKKESTDAQTAIELFKWCCKNVNMETQMVKIEFSEKSTTVMVL